MLNQDSLSQLKGLKDQMESEKERAEAVVKGTQSRYGFAVLDDGREIFIPPDEMLKVFPDDRIKVCIKPAKDDRPVADIERLVSSQVTEFCGRCVRKGKALFVEPDLERLSRWLFLPPHARNGVKDGDYVRAAILRHPIKDGKPQAKILQVIGDGDTPGIENLYTESKYQLPRDWSKDSLQALEQCLQSVNPLRDEKRRDLTDLEFVSIDATRTQDIDDALYAEISSDGWNLYVAIADPTAYIEPGSTLEHEIAARACSVYFHGDAIPMMPEQLSQQTCALSEDQERPALVCKIAVSDAGEVGEFEFIEAMVRSRAKLSYIAVDRYLAGNYDELMSHATPLEALYQVFRALRSRREEEGLVMEDRTEYRWILNDQKRIDRIETQDKLLSQKLVEECMVAANRCGALFLKQQGCSGPFVRHQGFRTDRPKEVSKFFERFLDAYKEQPTDDVASYRAIMKQLSESKELPLRTMVNRLLARAELSTQPGVHMGMALPCYSNCTSPLRKYTDFLTHRQIKRVLHGEPGNLVQQEQLQGISSQIQHVRQASMEAERWLKCLYMQGHSDGEFDAVISHINSSGFQVRLLSNGIEASVDLRGADEKFSFDRWTATLTSPSHRYQLEQTIVVTIKTVNLNQKTIEASPVKKASAGEAVAAADG